MREDIDNLTLNEALKLRGYLRGTETKGNGQRVPIVYDGAGVEVFRGNAADCWRWLYEQDPPAERPRNTDLFGAPIATDLFDL